MFQGETAITVDDKGRLTIPTSYRDQVADVCKNRLVVTYNPFETGCLWIFPYEEWERVRDDVNKLPSVKAVHRNLQSTHARAQGLQRKFCRSCRPKGL